MQKDNIPRVGKLERYYPVRTDDPLREIWRTWLKYSDFHYLDQEWPGHGDEEKLAVSTFIRQAHEFHAATVATSVVTKPLLIYYSLHNLAKAVPSAEGRAKAFGISRAVPNRSGEWAARAPGRGKRWIVLGAL